MKSPDKFFIAICVIPFVAGFAAIQAATSSVLYASQSVLAAGTNSSSGFTRPQIIETWGWILAQEKGVAKIEINETELAAFLKGTATAFKGQTIPYDTWKIFPDVERMAKTRREKVVRAITAKNEAKGREFFAEMEKDTNTVRLPDGLRYLIIEPGSGPHPKPKQTVNWHYFGHLIDGTEFIEFGPIDQVLVTNRFTVKPFMLEGIQKIGKGGKIRLAIPCSLVGKEVELMGIPPGSVMVYDVDLLDIKETPPAVLEDAELPPPPEPEPEPPSGYSDLQIIETWGWSVARSTHAASFEFTDAELALLTKGLVAGIKGQTPPFHIEKIYPNVEQFVSDCRQKARETFKRKQIAATQTFFADLKKNTNVVKLPSGLCYEILKPGTGPYPTFGKTVKMAYVGKLLDGKVFDKTDEDDTINVEISKTPPQWIIAGWTEGLQKINKGGKMKLYVPYSLAHGEEAVHNIPPYSSLIFEIEVKDITDTPRYDSAPVTNEPPVPAAK